MLAAAINPCPCGYYGNPTRNCNCPSPAIQRYLARVSGPLLDRIDIHIEVPAINFKELSSERRGGSSAVVRKRVQGSRNVQLTRFDSGTDPEAKLWVHATFIDSSLKVYERFITPLTKKERRNFYMDTLVLAHLMEIPDEILPQTPEDFDDYMESIIASDTLAVTSTAKRLSKAVFIPKWDSSHA